MKNHTHLFAGITAVSLLLSYAGVAAAAGEEKDKGTREGGPSSGPSGPSGGTSTSVPRDTTTGTAVVPERDPEKKPWEIGLAYEFHHLVVQNDLEGAAANKNVNSFDASAEWDPSKDDRIKLRAFLDERFLADPGETGLRMSDLILQYTHYFHFANDITFKPGAWVTAPISLASQKQGVISTPRVYAGLDKGFGKWVHVEPRAFGELNWAKYNANVGGNPNSKWALGLGVDAEVQMPFRPQLTFGADVSTAYYWYYQSGAPAGANGIGIGNPSLGSLQDSLASQPIQQTYGFEVYARYDLSEYQAPKVQPIHWDVTVSFANGDPVVGLPSAVHDGERDVYVAFRDNAELYAVISGRY